MKHNLQGLALLCAFVCVKASGIVSWPAPPGAPLNGDFTVQIRDSGGAWNDLSEYDALVNFDQPSHMSFVCFDADSGSSVEVRVVKNAGGVTSAKVRPDGAGITPAVYGDTVVFTLTSPEKVSLEINGDTYHNLFIFANPTEAAVIDSTGPGMHYFGPGMHTIGDGSGTVPLSLAGGDTVYIAGGAVVNGNILTSGIRDVTIMGRGILSGALFDHNVPDNQPKSGMMYLNNTRNLMVKDIILLNTSGWNVSVNYCDSAVFDNLKILGWTVNSDGINPRASDHVTIRNCLIRNDDDCVSIKLDYGVPGTSANVRGCRNILIEDCVFWADKGRVILIGPESFSTTDKVFEDIMVRNCDVLWSKNFDIDWARGVLAINCNDDAVVRNVTFEDIRVDAIHGTVNLVNLRLEKTPFGASAGAGIRNICFNRVTMKVPNQKTNVIYGQDAGRMVDGVHFTDLRINGRYIHSAPEGGFDVNGFTRDITFTAPIDTDAPPPFAWEFNTAGIAEGWSAGYNCTVDVSGGFFNVNVTARDASIFSPDNLHLDASEYPYFSVSLRNPTPDTVAQLFYFQESGGAWSESNSMQLKIVPNDTTLREYTVRLADMTTWTGFVSRLRFDPVYFVNTGLISIDRIAFVKSLPTPVHKPVAGEAGLSLEAHPNPFNPSTTIRYQLPGPVAATFIIYDCRGAMVKAFHLSGTSGTIVWDGRDSASGVYTGKLTTSDGRIMTHRLVLVR